MQGLVVLFQPVVKCLLGLVVLLQPVVKSLLGLVVLLQPVAVFSPLRNELSLPMKRQSIEYTAD